MDRRRLTGLIALLAFVVIVAGLVYYDSVSTRNDEPEVAFAPAQSADESVAPGETPIEPPSSLAAAPAEGGPAGDRAEAPPVEAETGTAAAPAEPPPAADAGPEEPGVAVAEPEPQPEGEGGGPARGIALGSGEEPRTVEAGGDDRQAAEATAPDAPAADGADVAAAAPADEPETVVAMAGPAADEPAAAEEPDGAGIVPETVPTFDVVRVEPSGETVVAGQAEPGATVEILDRAETIATATANDRGEWAMSIDEPLPPGAHDLAVRTTSKNRSIALLSDQRVAVSVPEDGSDDVLVVLNDPQSPSQVLQMPPAEEPQVAAIEPETPAEEPARPDVALVEPQAPAGEPATPEETAIAAAEPEAPAVEMGAPAGPAADAPEVAAAPASEPGGAEATVSEPGPTQVADAPMAAEPAIAAEPPIVVEPEIAGEPPAAAAPEAEASPPSVAAAEPEPEPAPPPEPVIVPEVAVAAVEADTAGALFIAGTAATGETVRVYLDDQPIGEATPSPSGTWLLEIRREMPPGTYRVRADQVDVSTGAVVARAEVPFEREIEVATLKPTASAGSASGAEVSGDAPKLETVIIKRGDNLWRIARQVYGRGIRYSTIYQANRDQIRNPRWIYPGQVFVLPAGNTAWQD